MLWRGLTRWPSPARFKSAFPRPFLRCFFLVTVNVVVKGDERPSVARNGVGMKFAGGDDQSAQPDCWIFLSDIKKIVPFRKVHYLFCLQWNNTQITQFTGKYQTFVLLQGSPDAIRYIHKSLYMEYTLRYPVHSLDCYMICNEQWKLWEVWDYGVEMDEVQKLSFIVSELALMVYGTGGGWSHWESGRW